MRFKLIVVLLLCILNTSICKSKNYESTGKIAESCQDALRLINSEEYHQAIPLLVRIIDFLKNDNADPDEIAVWLKGLGTSYLNIGQYAEAEKSYIDGIHLLDNPEYETSIVFRQLLDALTVFYIQVQQTTKAQECSNRAKYLYEINNDFGNDYARCLSNAAIVQAALGHNSLARMYVDVALRQAKDNYLSVEHTNDGLYWQQCVLPYVTMLNNVSQIYSDLGYFNDAAKAVKEAIKVSEENNHFEPLPYNNLGILYLTKSKYERAKEWFTKAYRYSRTPYEIDEVGMNAALSMFLAKDSTAPDFCSDVSSRMRDNINSSFAFLNTNERYNYWKHFEHYLPMLNLIIYQCGQQYHYGTIYDNILQSKGLLLRSTNQIRNAIFSSDNDEVKSAYNRLINLNYQTNVETDSIQRISIRKEIDQLDKWLTKEVNSYISFTANNSVNWETIKDNLGDSDVAIEFYNIPLVWGLDSIRSMDGEPQYCAVLLKRNYSYPSIIPLCREADIENLDLEELYITDEVYRLIWEPLKDELKGINNIFFSADRELHKIGIEYAMFPDSSYIFDHHTLHRLSSTRELAVKTKLNKIDEQAVLFGGLQYELDKEELIAESRSATFKSTSPSRSAYIGTLRYGVEYLPGTKTEVDSIARNFDAVGKFSYKLITGINGTEETFKGLDGRPIGLIHLATHGFFWSDDKAEARNYVNFLANTNSESQTIEDKALIRSGLFFSGVNIGLRGDSLPDDIEDGVLTAQEISTMNLATVDMVVMSACESGLGEISGDGVFGLQRGFKLAGARTLLMSLWKVDDEATRLLMTEFYRHYLSGKTKQESLCLAQKTLRNSEKYSDPHYWAAFILLDALN